MPNDRAILVGDPPFRRFPPATAVPEPSHQGRFAFQRLVTDLAARFAVTAATEIDRAVEDSLRDIGEALETDCIELWQFDTAAAGFVVTHRWTNGRIRPAGAWPTARIPHTASKLMNGQAVWFAGEARGGGAIDRETFRQVGLRSAVAVPLGAAGGSGHVRRSLMCGSSDGQRDWPTAVVQQLRLTAGIFSQALLRKASQAELQQALSELRELRDRAAEDDLRRPILSPERPPRRIVADSTAMADVLGQIKQVAPTPATVLLLGET